MKLVIDNVIVYTIKSCFVADINDFLSSLHVLQINKELIDDIAVKSHQNQDLQEQTQKKIIVLQAELEICRIHINCKTLSMSFIQFFRFYID